LRILLINAIDRRREVETSVRPLGLASLAAFVRERRPDVEFRISSHLPGPSDPFRPDIVGISSVTPNFPAAVEIAREARARGHLVVAGGIHISLVPENLTAYMDVAVAGEGEETFAEIVDTVRDGSGGKIEPDRFLEIPGTICRQRDGALRAAAPRPLIDPIDRIPRPARDLLHPTSANLYLVSSRGCPFQCIFCSSAAFWERARYFSAGYVVGEVASLVADYSARHVSFWDDLFVAPPERFRAIVAGIRAEGLQARLSFSAAAHAARVDEEVASALRSMNVAQVSIGLESGSDRILSTIKGPNASVVQGRRAVAALHGEGIAVTASFVIGAPGETMEDVRRTRALIRELPLARVGVYRLTPLPGTPLWEEASRIGLVSDGMDWRRLSMDDAGRRADPVVFPGPLGQSELRRLHRALLRTARRKRALYLAARLAKSPRSMLASARRRLASYTEHLRVRYYER